MIKRMPTHCGDETCSSCVVAGDFIYLAHHAGGFDKQEIAHQMRAAFESIKRTLASIGGTLDDMIQINLYLKNKEDFGGAREVFCEYFNKEYPARMTIITEFLDERCLCQIDGVAYKSHNGSMEALEERISCLEKKLNTIAFGENKEISFNDCRIENMEAGPSCSITCNSTPIGDIGLGNDCTLNFDKCTIGAVLDSDLEDAEERLDDLECRLDDLNSQMDDIDNR